MAEEMDFELRLDDTVEEVEGEAQAPVEVEPQQVPVEMEVEPGAQAPVEVEPQQVPVEMEVEPGVGPARFHNVVEVRNYTKYELEGSPTLWFDEFQKAYVLSKEGTATTYLKCHRYTVKRGKLIFWIVSFLKIELVKLFTILVS